MARLEIPIKVDIYKIEELIDQLKHLQTYKLSAGDEMTLVDRDEVVEIITDHVKAEVSPPDQRWIPCSERLPEYDAPALLSTAWGKTEIGWWTQRGWMIVPASYREFKQDAVVAWMPLPAPYRTEGEEHERAYL